MLKSFKITFCLTNHIAKSSVKKCICHFNTWSAVIYREALSPRIHNHLSTFPGKKKNVFTSKTQPSRVTRGTSLAVIASLQLLSQQYVTVLRASRRWHGWDHLCLLLFSLPTSLSQFRFPGRPLGPQETLPRFLCFRSSFLTTHFL